MPHRLRRTLLACLVTVAALSFPRTSQAYGGPGSVISGIGALLAVLAAIVASIFGFLWFPLKRLYRKIRGGKAGGEMAEPPPTRE